MSPSNDANKYIVRFPEGMRDKIKEAAKDSGRSMNAEIVSRLQQTFGIDFTAPETGNDELRDRFAIEAMRTMFADEKNWTQPRIDLNATTCYEIAGAMLKARNA